MNKTAKRSLAALAAVVLIGTVAWAVPQHGRELAANDGGSGGLMDDRQVGDPHAPVKMVEYFSLTCPHCAKFEEETFPKIKADYIDTGKVLFVSRAYPVDKAGLQAAEMARCAPADRYFPLVDWLFKAQQQWGLAADPVAAMRPLGKFAGMSDKELDACFANKDLQDYIVSVRQQGEQRFGIDSTPTFILNDGADKIKGAETYEKFKSSIDALLAKKT